MKVQSLTYSLQPPQQSPIRQSYKSKKPISALRKVSPLKKEPCPQGIMTALFSKLARYSSLNSQTRYGYYPGGTYIQAVSSHAPPSPPIDPPSLFQASYPTPLSNTLTLRGEAKPFNHKRSMSRERVSNRSNTRPIGQSAMVSPKSLAIIGALGTPRRPRRPMTARKALVEGQHIRPREHRLRFVRASPERPRIVRKSEGITVIDVLIPSPKFKKTPPQFPAGSHLKVRSQQYESDFGLVEIDVRTSNNTSTMSDARLRETDRQIRKENVE